MTHHRANYEYGTTRRGDHSWYISDLSKAREHYSWSTRDLYSIFDEILGSWRERLAGAVA